MRAHEPGAVVKARKPSIQLFLRRLRPPHQAQARQQPQNGGAQPPHALLRVQRQQDDNDDENVERESQQKQEPDARHLRLQKGEVEQKQRHEQRQHRQLEQHRHHQQHHGRFSYFVTVRAHEQHLKGLPAAGRGSDGAEEELDEVILVAAQRSHRPPHAAKKHRGGGRAQIEVYRHAHKPQADQPGVRAAQGREHRLHVTVAQKPPKGRTDQRGEQEKLQNNIPAGLFVHFVHTRPLYHSARPRTTRRVAREHF